MVTLLLCIEAKTVGFCLDTPECVARAIIFIIYFYLKTKLIHIYKILRLFRVFEHKFEKYSFFLNFLLDFNFQKLYIKRACRKRYAFSVAVAAGKKYKTHTDKCNIGG